VRPPGRLAACQALRFASPSAIPDGTGLDAPRRPGQARGVLNPDRQEAAMNSSTRTHRGPTPKQLRYLRVLAEQTGTTFAPPTSSAEASREIDRLAALKRERGTHRELPDSAEQVVYATAPAPDETSGWGSTATWRISSPPRAVTARPSGVGQRTELARYRVSAGERVIYGQRINGCVRVTDCPSSGAGGSLLLRARTGARGFL